MRLKTNFTCHLQMDENFRFSKHLNPTSINKPLLSICHSLPFSFSPSFPKIYLYVPFFVVDLLHMEAFIGVYCCENISIYIHNFFLLLLLHNVLFCCLSNNSNKKKSPSFVRCEIAMDKKSVCRKSFSFSRWMCSVHVMKCHFSSVLEKYWIAFKWLMHNTQASMNVSAEEQNNR